jgi:hypothetical protein
VFKGGVDVADALGAAVASNARRAGGSALVGVPFVGGVPLDGGLLAPAIAPGCPYGEPVLAARRGSTDAAVCKSIANVGTKRRTGTFPGRSLSFHHSVQK